MSDELKACPFHNSEPRNTCGCYYALDMSDRDWNTRPLEDALRARAERAERMVERLINVGNQMVHSRTAILTAATLREAWNEDVAEWRNREVRE